MSFLVYVFFAWVGISQKWTATVQNYKIMDELTNGNETDSNISNTDMVQEPRKSVEVPTKNSSLCETAADERANTSGMDETYFIDENNVSENPEKVHGERAPHCVDVFNCPAEKEETKNFKNHEKSGIKNLEQCSASESCLERCHRETDDSLECSCSKHCLFYGDCCFDFFELCHKTSLDELEWALTDSELFTQNSSLLNHTIHETDIPDGKWLDVTYNVSCRSEVHQAMSSENFSVIFQSVGCFHCGSAKCRISDNSKETAGFKMVSVCPQSWTNVDVKSSCENQAPTFDNPPFHDSVFPSVTYRNIHCAQCHGRNIDLLRRWNVSLMCPQIQNLEDRIKDTDFLKKNCSCTFNPFFEFRIKPCMSPSPVLQMDNSLKGNVEKSELPEAKPDLSGNLKGKSTMTYNIKNVYQLWCGLYGQDQNESLCFCSRYNTQPTSHPRQITPNECTSEIYCRSLVPLSVLFSIDNSYRIKVDRVETDTEVEIPDAKTCENDQVYSPIDQICLRVECPAGQRFQYGTCAEDTLRLLSPEGKCFAVLLLHVRISLLSHVPVPRRIEAKSVSKILETRFEQYAGEISVESFNPSLVSTKTDSMESGQIARDSQYCDVHDESEKSDIDSESINSHSDEGSKESRVDNEANNYESDQARHVAEVENGYKPSEVVEGCKHSPTGDENLDNDSGSVTPHSEALPRVRTRRTLINELQHRERCESKTFVNVTVKLRSKKWSEMVRVVDIVDKISRESKNFAWVHQKKTVVGCFNSFTLTNFDPFTEIDCPDGDIISYHNFTYVKGDNRFVEFDIRGLDKKVSLGRITDKLFLSRTAGWKRQKTVSFCGTANKTDPNNCSLILGFRHHFYSFSEDGSIGIYINNSEYRTRVFQNSTNLLLICSKNLKKISSREVLDYSPAEIMLGYVCRSASLVGLVLTVFTYSVFKKLRNVPGKIVICLSVCLLLVTMLSLFIGEFEGHWLFCPLSACLLQYFFLCTFCWMNTLATDIARSFREDVIPSDDEKKKALRFRFYCLYAITLPLLFTVAPIVTEYIRKDWVDWTYLYDTQQYCWLHKDFRYFFHVPVMLLLVVNGFLFVRSVKSIRTVSKITKTAKLRSEEKGNMLLFLKLFLVMGLSWLLTFVGSNSESVADSVLSLLSSLQGVFIFITFVCNSRVVRLYRAKFRKMWEGNQEGSEMTIVSLQSK